MGIRLHKKYGLNPSIDTCIICGKPKAIVLFGSSMKEEAPMKVITSIEPCDECKRKYLLRGVLLVEVDENGKPTGALAVITEEAFEKIFTAPIPKSRICRTEIGLLKKIGAIK